MDFSDKETVEILPVPELLLNSSWLGKSDFPNFVAPF